MSSADDRRRPLVSHGLVAAQMAAIAGCLAPLGGAPGGPAAALALSALGAAAGAWTLWHNRPGNFGIYPEPRPRARLVTGGPYALVRHPMYAALLLFMAGAALYNGAVVNVAALGALVAVVAAKARREERALAARFPEYARYAARTRRFIPYVI